MRHFITNMAYHLIRDAIAGKVIFTILSLLCGMFFGCYVCLFIKTLRLIAFEQSCASKYEKKKRVCLSGLYRVPGRILMQHSRGAINCSPAAWMCSSTTQPKGSAKEHASGGRTEEETTERPEYIPSRKAKNPMMSIGYAWYVPILPFTINSKK